MSASGILSLVTSSARHRRAWIVVASWLPWLVAACAIAWRVAGVAGVVLALLAAALGLAALVVDSMRRFDDAWAARQLDNRWPELEDSTGLLLPANTPLNPLQRLQRARIERRLTGAPDVRPPWPSRAITFSWLLGAAATAAVQLLTVRAPSPPVADVTRPAQPSQAAAPALLGGSLTITPPAYTGLPSRTEDVLDARLPAGSTLHWRLRFEPQPASVELVFHDRSRVPLAAVDGAWTAERTIERPALYRVVVDAASSTAASRHRLDVVPDRGPAITVVKPSQNVTLHAAGQREWQLQFEATDDYGLGAARLHLTLAQGGGENVTVTERVLAIRGQGDRRRKQYSHRLDLHSLGLAQGDDLIVRLGVDDNQVPQPNTARSASLILRWPPDAGEEPTGLEGMVSRTLPAYFRSQRQVIIDTEALIAERSRLPADRFTDRSDSIGMDQRLLRLRYGQFLGEEAEDGPEAPGEEHAGHADEPGAASSEATAVLEEFGHTHDIPEAATLLDRDTRELLRSALREMWQAELHLRQGKPVQALPYEYRALDRIKQVQQATRIYLARVGLELPPIDESRRLAGDATGVRSRADVLVTSTIDEAFLASWWTKLDETPAADRSPAPSLQAGDLEELAAWIRARETRLPQALELQAAIDALGLDRDCGPCRRELRALLWPLLPAPATSTRTRPESSATGAAYLDALQAEAAQ